MRLSSYIWFGSAALLLLLGCGGGGGGAGGGGGGGQLVVAAPGQYMEFLRSNGTWFDPFNLQVGDAGKAVVANYDAFGVRTVLPGSNWNTTLGSTFVSINASTGQFKVLQAGGGPFKFRTTVTLGGFPTLFEQGARMPVATPTVSGRVVELGKFTGLPSNVGIPHVGVDFFDSTGTLLGSARTMPDGTFSGHTPTNTALMMLQSSSIKTSLYYVDVYWEGVHYSPVDTACRIAVGPLINGDNPLPSTPAVPLKSGGPPPPPGGCT